MKNSIRTGIVLVLLLSLMVSCVIFIVRNDPGNEQETDSSDQTTPLVLESTQVSNHAITVEEESNVQSDKETTNSFIGDNQAVNNDIDFTDAPPRTQAFLNAVKNVYEMVYYGDYEYGDSKSAPPCADGIISGDRLVARALWDMGFTDQPTGGIVSSSFITYLPEHGFEVITDKSQLRAGDIVQVTVYDRPDNKVFDYTFVLVSYDPATEYCSKYDMSLNTMDGKSRLDCIQPFHAPLEENGKMRVFKHAFRIR